MSRLHRWILGLHPRAYREEMGSAIEETLARRRAEAEARGAVARARFWLRETLGLLVSAARERRLAAQRGRREKARRGGPSAGGLPPLDRLAREARHAARRLAAAPAFTSASVLTLALGIGATTAIFAVVERVVIAPLPYPDSDRIVFLDHGARGLDRPRGLGMTTGLYWQYAHRARTLEHVTVYQPLQATIAAGSGAGDPETIEAVRTTPSFVHALGVTPALGRWFDEAEGRPGGDPVVVLSHGFWLRRFGGDPAALGRTLVLNDTSHEIIGVMPEGFAYPRTQTQLWYPHPLDEGNVRVGSFSYAGVARLAGGATVEEARAEIDALIARVPGDFPDDEFAALLVEQADAYSSLLPLQDSIVGSTERTLWILLAAVGIVLAIACTNVANLFLVRAEVRQREVALRRALGAGRGVVAGFFLTETALLALLGGGLGVALAYGAVELLVSFGPAELPRLGEVRMGAASLGFAALMAALAAGALGVLPLLRQPSELGAGLAKTLQEGGRGRTSAHGRVRGRSLLMGGQVALAVVLLVAAALLARSFQELRAADPGFDARDGLLVRLVLPVAAYPDREQAAAFHERLLERLRGLPGVRSAAVTTCPPLASYCFGDPVSRPGRPWTEGAIPPIASFRRVSDDWFETAGTSLVRGRLLEEGDHREATRAVVVDERMAELYFPGEDPIGQRILTSDADPVEDAYEIVGVVEHVVVFAVASTDRPPEVYLPLLSHTTNNSPTLHNAAYLLRADGDPLALADGFRAALAELDPAVPAAEVTTLEGLLAQDRAPMAFTMALILIAGAVALALGLIGIYGVVSFVVAQRRGEIGVRLALGGRPGDVAGMILWQGARVAGLGMAVGLVAAAAGSRVLSSLLYGVSPTDPRVYAAVSVLLLGVTLVACWLPARRASALDPAHALRAE